MAKLWPIAILVCGWAAAGLGTAARADAQDAPPAAGDASTPAKPAESGLTAGQRQVADRFRELEKLLLRMAELTAPSDPRRAALLRQAVAQSKERDIDHQFEELVELLRQERLAVVVKNQGEVQQDLARLLDLLLSEDRSKRIESEKERVREYLKRVNKIIKEQKSVQGETARGADAHPLADKQAELADKTGKLADDLKEDAGPKPQGQPTDEGDKDDKKKDPDKKDPDKEDAEKKDSDKNDAEKKDAEKKDAEQKDKADGKPSDKPNDGDKPQDGDKSKDKNQKGEGKDAKKSDAPGGKPQDQPPPQGEPQQGQGQPGEPGQQPVDPAQKRLEQAQQRMKEAQQKLEEAKRTEAADKQAEAIKELEAAKADLEEILRQLREEEMSRTLAMLETRFRKMLEAQIEVFEGTKRLDKVAQAERDRDDEIEAGRLSRKEAGISTEAEKALTVLREEGSAVAFPEAVMAMREDMNQVVSRLAEAKVGEVTQGIETDIIAALEEMIAALQKAQKDMEKKDQQGQPPPMGESDEPPLVDTLSELKMIRAMQMRVNLRTERYAQLTKTEQADTPDLLEALKRLAEREQRIHKVTRDIVVGRNR